jgi:hypothetical protein
MLRFFPTKSLYCNLSSKEDLEAGPTIRKGVAPLSRWERAAGPPNLLLPVRLFRDLVRLWQSLPRRPFCYRIDLHGPGICDWADKAVSGRVFSVRGPSHSGKLPAT